MKVGLMASAGVRAYKGVWGLSSQRGPGQSPWSGGLAGEASAVRST